MGAIVNLTQTVKPALKYRKTVSGLFQCLSSHGDVLIGIHWPQKAALAEESNLSPVAGEWRDGETAEAALRRQILSEYGLVESDVKIFPLEHPHFVSQANLKQYYWLLVALSRPVGETAKISAPAIGGNPKDVASFGWYGVSQLEGALSLMHREKAYMFRQVLKIAIAIEPDLRPFAKRFG
jgi:hypothetical protein